MSKQVPGREGGGSGSPGVNDGISQAPSHYVAASRRGLGDVPPVRAEEVAETDLPRLYFCVCALSRALLTGTALYPLMFHETPAPNLAESCCCARNTTCTTICEHGPTNSPTFQGALAFSCFRTCCGIVLGGTVKERHVSDWTASSRSSYPLGSA